MLIDVQSTLDANLGYLCRTRCPSATPQVETGFGGNPMVFGAPIRSRARCFALRQGLRRARYPKRFAASVRDFLF